MTGNALTMFNEGGRPAHLDTFFPESNIESRTTVNSLSYQGKTWTVAINGEKTKLQKKNADGDVEPVTVMKVIVLDYAKRRGRTYYPGTYDQDKEQAPICWSADGIKPHDSLAGPFPQGSKEDLDIATPHKMSSKCDGCRMAVKGSKVVGDKQMAACSQHRLLAVLPAFGLGKFPALRLKIAVTSDFDKQSPEAAQAAIDNKFAFQQYMDFLKSRGVKHSADLVTKISFDMSAPYPKLFFSPDRWLEANEAQQVLPILKAKETVDLVTDTWTPAGVDGVRTDDTTAAIEAPQTEAQVATAASVDVGNAAPAAGNAVSASTAASPAASPSTAPAADDDDGEIILEGIDAPAPAAAQEPAQAALTPEPATQQPSPAAAAEKAAEAAPPASTKVAADVEALLADWQ